MARMIAPLVTGQYEECQEWAEKVVEASFARQRTPVKAAIANAVLRLFTPVPLTPQGCRLWPELGSRPIQHIG